MRRCSACGEQKPLADYYRRSGRCHACILAYQREYKRKHRRALGIPTHRKESCPQGHLLTEDNLRGGRVIETGRRSCLACHRERNREQERLRRRAAGARDIQGRTHCLHGHALVEGNLRTGRHVGACLLCHRLRERRRYDDSARDYIAILLKDPCSYCGGPGGTIDHIEPVALGGSDDWQNLTAACRSCNARKRTRRLVQFMLAA